MREVTPSIREATAGLMGPALLLASGFAFFLAATGAFDTGAAAAGPRFAYWLLVMIGGAVMVPGALRWSERVSRLAGAPPLRIIAVALVVAAPELLLVLASRALLLDDPPSWVRVQMLVPQILLVAATATLLLLLLVRSPSAVPAARIPPDAQAALIRRLPPDLRGSPLLAVEAEDHYLRLHTDAGSCLILMSMAEAMAELGGLEGARTHRSWWVARAAIVGAERGNGRARLSLRNGITVPVSRTYSPQLRAAGWY